MEMVQLGVTMQIFHHAIGHLDILEPLYELSLVFVVPLAFILFFRVLHSLMMFVTIYVTKTRAYLCLQSLLSVQHAPQVYQLWVVTDLTRFRWRPYLLWRLR